jgi:ribosomal protein S27AE
MDIGSLLLILALLVLVAVYILQPLRDKHAVSVNQKDIALSPLLAERERILDALAELDFDHELGKVPENVYPLQRDRLMQRGAEVLRQLDEYKKDGGLDAEASVDSKDDPLEVMIAARRKSQKSPGKAQFCPECGKKVKAKDRFCVNCGAKL